MVRTQIQLTEEQSRAVRNAAERRGVSMAEIIRRCIDRGLTEEGSSLAERYARARTVIGAFRDREGATDVSEEHDAYLDSAYG